LNGIGSVTGAVGRFLTPDEDKSKAQLNDQIDDVYRLRDAVEALGGTIDKNASFKDFRAANLVGALGLPENATIAQVDRRQG
jgi:hypothetical protein